MLISIFIWLKLYQWIDGASNTGQSDTCFHAKNYQKRLEIDVEKSCKYKLYLVQPLFSQNLYFDNL